MDVTSLRFPCSFSQFIYISHSLSERKSVPAAKTACSQALKSNLQLILDAVTEQGIVLGFIYLEILLRDSRCPHLLAIPQIHYLNSSKYLLGICHKISRDSEFTLTLFSPVLLQQSKKKINRKKPKYKTLRKYTVFSTQILQRSF